MSRGLKKGGLDPVLLSHPLSSSDHRVPDVASDADVNPDAQRLLNFHREIGITEPQCPVPVGPQPDAISDPCQDLFINVPAVRNPVIFSASDLLLTVPVWQLLAVVPVAVSVEAALHGLVVSWGTLRTRLGEDGASRPRLL